MVVSVTLHRFLKLVGGGADLSEILTQKKTHFKNTVLINMLIFKMCFGELQ